VYAIAVVMVIGAGLLWRSGWIPLPRSVSKYGGDALWALMVFFGLGFVFVRGSTLCVAVSAVCFAWSVEFLQLYHAPWIDGIRSNRLGHLVLGSVFNGPDLVAYGVGIAVGVVVEWGWLRRLGRRV
jgi:Protein of unknown function (DUF2809)